MADFELRAVFEALDEQRIARGLTWTGVAREVRGFSPAMLTNLSKGSRVGLPDVMRLVAWLDEPAVRFVRISDR